MKKMMEEAEKDPQFKLFMEALSFDRICISRTILFAMHSCIAHPPSHPVYMRIVAAVVYRMEHGLDS